MPRIVLLLICACATNGPNKAGDKPGGPSGPSNNNQTGAEFTTEDVQGCSKNPGMQTVIAVKGSGVALVTWADVDETSTCTTMSNTPTQQRMRQVCYAESDGAGAFTATEVARVQSVQLSGLGLAVSANGEVSVGYTGGPNALQSCGGSDMIVAKKSGASFTPSTIATDSQSDVVPADQMDECVQATCNFGDATGFSPALAYDKNNMLIAIFRDLHTEASADSLGKSDVELARGGIVTTLDVASGGGEDNRVAVDSNGKLSVVYRNRNGTKQSQQGLWSIRETASGFSRQRITTKGSGPGLGFAVNAQGLHGLAFYDTTDNKLSYMESVDGITWTSPEDVDTDGITGQTPSLAFDGSGEPAISYYRCADKSPTSTSCKQNEDGLYLARRVQGLWKVQKVVADSLSADGLDSALAFVNGKAVIAYRQDSSGSSLLKVAKEP